MRVLLLVCLALFPIAAAAQGTATLVADNLLLTEGDRLTATGNVEVFYDGTRLTAERITYSQSGDSLSIDGPILITQADGTILTASQATLDPTIENGILRSARIVLDRQLQLAATQIDRIDGRYSQLYRSVATSCQVCGDRPPLWEIRAERVVHDEEAQLLYFTGAQFRIRGVPVFYLPRLRLPDPTLERATGFLIPRIRTNDNLGTGLKAPYFIVLGPSRDLLLTPYIASRTTTLELRYRQAFRNGFLRIEGAFSDDELRDEDRSYVFAEGVFDLPRDFRLAFDVEATSDEAYLLDYGYSDKDRLDSAIALTRVTDDSLFAADFTYFESLREDERNASLPPIVANLSYARRMALAGGHLRWIIGADAIERYGEGTGEAGRDVRRIGGAASYTRDWLAAGVVATTRLSGRIDAYTLSDAPDFEGEVVRVLPTATLVLRYPLVRRSGGTTDLIEPVFALHWSDVTGDPLPNEDSTRPELDQGNLLLANHFPGEDRVETGLRGAVGLRWSRRGPNGTQTKLTLGRTFREETDADFTRASGQTGYASDYLIAGQVDLPQGVRVEARSLIEEDGEPSLTNARMSWRRDDLDLSAAYIWQGPDAALGRPDAISEWSLETDIRVTPAWAVSFDARYDIAEDRPARAGVGVEWRNECVTVALSASRRYTSSLNVAPSTDYGLSVSLSGFSAGREGVGPKAACRN